MTLPAAASLSRVTPLGVRLRDDLTGRPVVDGLSVRAWPRGEPWRQVQARLNHGEVWCLHDLPGLRDLEFGAGDDAYWASLPRRLPFIVEVIDAQGRYLPLCFEALAPHRGLFTLACGPGLSPLSPPPGGARDGVTLRSSPTRRQQAGVTIVRAELWDDAARRPAAWAVLEARTPGAAARGDPPALSVADGRGRVAVHLLLDDDRDLDGGPLDSPLGPAPAPLPARTFAVDLALRYDGSIVPPSPPPPTAAGPRGGTPLPDLCAALRQAPGRLWERRGMAPLSLGRATLRFGADNVLRSTSIANAPAGALLVTPGP